jgi:hypothetical protein
MKKLGVRRSVSPNRVTPFVTPLGNSNRLGPRLGLPLIPNRTLECHASHGRALGENLERKIPIRPLTHKATLSVWFRFYAQLAAEQRGNAQPVPICRHDSHVRLKVQHLAREIPFFASRKGELGFSSRRRQRRPEPAAGDLVVKAP